MSRPERRNRPGGATIEVVRRGTRDGIVLEVDIESLLRIRVVLESAFDVAGALPRRLVSDPGWWVALIASEAINADCCVVVQRIIERHERHVVVEVEPSRLAALHPDWPMVRFREGGDLFDLRGETALRHGPSDLELAAYLGTLPEIDRPSPPDLRRMFDLGVLQWERTYATGRRGLVHAT